MSPQSLPSSAPGFSSCIITARADDTASTQPADDSSEASVATVETGTLHQGDISQTTVAFGSVTAQPGTISVLSVPYECRVSKMLVSSGQPVEKDADLIDVEPSPAATLSLLEAQSNLEIATQDLAQTKERFGLKLATNSDLLQSQQALKLAQLRIDNLKTQGLLGEKHHIPRADFQGFIAKVDAQQGQIVPGGNPLIETIARDQLEVRVGVEPSVVPRLAIGQTAQLFAGDAQMPGKIRLITQRVNPDTRLVDVFITPSSRDALLLDGFVRAELATDTKTALIAPRDAVLPDDNAFTLFTIKDGKAVKHTVTVGLHNNQEVAVTGDDLHTGDTVVVQGNLELDDQMAVTTRETR